MKAGESRRDRRSAALTLVSGALFLLGSAVASAQASQPASLMGQAAAQVQADGRRSIALLPSNLARGVAGVFATDSLRPLLVGAAATGVSSLFDHRVRDAIGNPDSTFGKVGDAAGGGLVMGSVVGGLFVAGRASHNQRFRAATYDMPTGVLAAQVCTLLLKVAVNRTRPGGPSSRIGSSFPSGHTTTAIALATVIEKHAGWKAGVPAYAVASLVAASRVRYNQHYLSDVVAGATVALIAGRTAVRMNGRPLPASKKGRRTTVSISPLGGSGLRVAVEF